MSRDPQPYYERDDFVHQQRRFFPSKIPVKHHQLRHLISSPSPGIIYYVHDRDVFRIDTRSGKKLRTHITELLFGARCITTGFGWFCAGGDADGQFAALKITEGLPANGEVFGHERLDELLNSVIHESGAAPRHCRFGGDIVNSVTLARLPWEKEDGSKGHDIVAILTNNDMSVKTYALNEQQELWQGNYDCPPNHATVSPDATLLFVVGDYEVGYIYRRRSISIPRDASYDGRAVFPTWDLLRRLPLHSPPNVEANHAAYFTTAWSEDGRLFATASEYGYVQVFDTGKLDDLDSDPLLVIAPSSRPMKLAGAVRGLTFSPAPWDFLIWIENTGKVCVADCRNGLLARQTISLDSTAESTERVELSDASRRLGNYSSGPAADWNNDLLRLARERDTTLSALEGLSSQEQDTLRSLRLSRERQQQASSASRATLPSQRSTVGTSRPRSNTAGGNATSAGSGTNGDGEGQTSEHAHRRSLGLLANEPIASTLPPGTPDPWLSDPILRQSQAAGNASPRPQNPHAAEVDELPELMPSSAGPRYRSYSVSPARPIPNIPNRQVLSLLEMERAQARRRGANLSRPAEASDESLTSLGYSVRAREQREQREQRAQDATRADEGGPLADARARRAGVSAFMRRRALEADFGAVGEPTGIADPTSGYYYTAYRPQGLPPGMEDVPRGEAGIGTAGMSLSADGRTLYAATEEGVFELAMNFQSRKYWPAADIA